MILPVVKPMIGYSESRKYSYNAQELIRNIASGKYKAVVSSLVYGEVLSVGTGKQPIDLENFIEQIRNLSTIVCDDYVCLRAGELKLKQGKGLKLPDAIHLVTAIKNSADLFITNDMRLAKKANVYIPTRLLAERL